MRNFVRTALVTVAGASLAWLTAVSFAAPSFAAPPGPVEQPTLAPPADPCAHDACPKPQPTLTLFPCWDLAGCETPEPQPTLTVDPCFFNPGSCEPEPTPTDSTPAPGGSGSGSGGNTGGAQPGTGGTGGTGGDDAERAGERAAKSGKSDETDPATEPVRSDSETDAEQAPAPERGSLPLALAGALLIAGGSATGAWIIARRRRG